MKTMLKCGCAAAEVLSARHGVTFDPPLPYCVVHDCIEVAPETPDLTGRTAKCVYCRRTEPSSLDLAFFESGYWSKGQRLTDHDSFYCGCRGWD